VLIPWAAASGSLAGGWPLLLCWLASVSWSFGFDTVYAMADRDDDRALGVRSSALSLGAAAPLAVSICYGFTAAALALAALYQGVSIVFWPLWLVVAAGMQHQVWLLQQWERRGLAVGGSPAPPGPSPPPRSIYARHFGQQVWLGGLMLLALVLGRLS
jgi:4-hydroxybenzoate polyprenyltransferase